MLREIEYAGAPLYFLADDLGQPWLGGWRSRETAEARLDQCEAAGWDADRIDDSVDVRIEEVLAS